MLCERLTRWTLMPQRASRSMTPAGSGPPAIDALPVMIFRISRGGCARRFGVCRLWFSGQVDNIVGARCCEVKGWRRSFVVAFSTPGRSFCALLKDSRFRVVLLCGLRGVHVGEASNPGPIRQSADSQLPTRRCKQWGQQQAIAEVWLWKLRLGSLTPVQLFCRVHHA